MMDAARARLSQARAATARGEHAEALEGFLWFHRHVVAIDPSLRGVRLSFALLDWSRLAAVYPPAGEAMRRTRTEATAAALDRSRSDAQRAEAFSDAAALNEELRDDVATVDLYRTLARSAPQVADRCNRAAFRAVADSDDVALARRCLGDPDVVIRRAAKVFSIVLSRPAAPARHPELAARRRPSRARFYLAQVERVCRVLTASGESSLVPLIRQLACELAPEPIRLDVTAALNGLSPT